MDSDACSGDYVHKGGSMSFFNTGSDTLSKMNDFIEQQRGESWLSAGIPMSSAAHPCYRKVWYDLHWVSGVKEFEARILRLFETGEIYEERLLDWLEGVHGVEVQRFDDKGKQLKAVLAGGFLRGKLDGRCIGLPEAPKTPHTIECKSHNDKSFKGVVKAGVKEGKPEHYAQMQSYMHAMGDTRALYMAINKNDEEIYLERVEYNVEYCLKMISKCEAVAKSEEPPHKLHEDPRKRGALECRWCDHKGVCHDNMFPESMNCRTCAHVSTSLDGNATWKCALTGHPLSYSEQREGCSAHLLIPEIVPGELIDFDEDKLIATYRLNDGREWKDSRSLEIS